MEINPTEYYEVFNAPSGGDDIPLVIEDLFRELPSGAARAHVNESSVAFWAVIDGILMVFILSGNILTILAVRFSRRLRSVISNMFILSLAISDTVVGFTLPYHLAFYIGASSLGESQIWCLLRFFLIILACCVSIWNLIAIALDRYIAIVYPLHYSRYITRKVAIFLLGIGWVMGAAIAAIPLFWNNWSTATSCEFDEVLPPWYVAGIITPGFAMIWICMLIVYWRIWREASKHVKHLRSSASGIHEIPSDWKSVQVVLFILGCFSICWLPYFVIACAQIFKFIESSSPTLYKGAFSLAMANSGMNPIIYAWKNTSFRRAFARLLRCQSPDYIDVSQHSTRSNVHRKSSSLQHHNQTPPNSATSGNFNAFTDNMVVARTNSDSSQCSQYNLNDIRRPLKKTTLKLPIAETVVLANGSTVKNEKCEVRFEKNVIMPIAAVPEENMKSSSVRLTGFRTKGLVIQRIDCDGNANTEIRIVNTNDGLKPATPIEMRNYLSVSDPTTPQQLLATGALNEKNLIINGFSSHFCKSQLI